MATITPFLWFEDKAEEAAEFYVSGFKHAKILNKQSMSDVAPGPKGDRIITFELEGTTFTAFNGGAVDGFTFSPATSFVINCKDQAEVDYYWERLSAVPEAEQCGWLRDKFGVTWQVVPTAMQEILGGPDPAGSQRAVQVMLKMKKLDIAVLKKAYEGR